MRWTDDEIARAMKELNPSRGLAPRSSTEDAAALARVHAAVQTDAAQRSTRRVRHSRMLALPLAAVTLFALVIVFTVATPTPTAFAHGPQPLAFHPVDTPRDELVADLIKLLREDSTGVTASARESRSSGWYSELRAGDTDPGPAVIRPEERRLVWHEDLSGSLEVRAGVAFGSDGSPVVDPVPEAGTLIYVERFAPGTFTAREIAEPATDLRALTATINAHAQGPSTTGAADHITGITSLLGIWTLTNAHHATMLNIIGRDKDVVVEGTTVDRLGRPAVGLRAPSHSTPWIHSIVLVSSDTGRIIGTEEMYVGGGSELPVPTGSVIAYTLWGDTK